MLDIRLIRTETEMVKKALARRKEEGAKIVEMEQSGCIAVAQFRGFDYGALILLKGKCKVLI